MIHNNNYFMPSWATGKIIAPESNVLLPDAVRPRTTVQQVFHSTEGAMVLTVAHELFYYTTRVFMPF